MMEVHLTPEQHHQLVELAAQRGRDADTLAQEAISRYLAEEKLALLKP
jgi:predicted transcriptional regulator